MSSVSSFRRQCDPTHETVVRLVGHLSHPTQANIDRARRRAKVRDSRQVIYSYDYRDTRRIAVDDASIEDYDEFRAFCGCVLVTVYPDGEIDGEIQSSS